MAVPQTLFLYDNCQNDTWVENHGPSINSVTPASYKQFHVGSALFIENNSSSEMGGALISNNYPILVGPYFGMDIEYVVSSLDLPHLARNEMDLKITVKSASGGSTPNQANGSAQQNASKNWMWQLDPTGRQWVDTGFIPGPPKTDAVNTMQFRYWTDGNRWSVTGLNHNGVVFTPGSQFQNLPMISTNWGSGLHPQLQTECQSTPWALRQGYTKVRLWSSSNPIPWNL